MPKCHTYSLTFLILLSWQVLTQAQSYQRILLAGGSSVCVIPKTVVDQPNDKTGYKNPFTGIQFQKKGVLISIRALEIANYKAIQGFNHKTAPEALVQYTQYQYDPVDANCIAFNTLQTGKLQEQYPFAEVLEINRSDCSDGSFDYSVLQERLIIVGEYLYILNVFESKSCVDERSILKVKKIVQSNFNRLIRSFKTNKTHPNT